MEIFETRNWNTIGVRAMCVNMGLYTNGTSSEYEALLNYVRNHRTPSLEDIYHVAKDIDLHSEGQTVTGIMYVLANDVIKSCFDIEY